MRWISGGVTAAAGFRASGVSAGLKRSRKPDMALVVSDVPAVCAGTLTTNRIKAAPVVISRQRLKAGRAQAVLLNSGCANCLTGAQGMRDALALSRSTANALGVAERHVLTASTGMIGRRLPVPRMQRMIPELAARLGRRGHHAAALGILTTDTMAKEAAVEGRIGNRLCRLGGMAKGAGMIAPSMATMLCVLTTDVAMEPSLLRRLVREAVEATFNRISVDADMSTNDSVFILANGASGVRIRPNTPAAKQWSAMLQAVCQRLAHLIVKDGEGATRLAMIEVVGARNDPQALRCARQIAGSSLVRTMLAGGDPNVGRVAAAAGASGAWFRPEALEIRIGERTVVSRGDTIALGKELARRLMSPRELRVQVDLQAGRGRARMVTCDLTEAYVRLNASYST